MKRIVNLSIALFALVAVASCGGAKSFGKMDGGFGTESGAISYTCAPEVLALNNGVVAGQISMSFTPDYFNSKVILKVIPVMVYEGGEVEGTPFYYQGSEVEDNYTVVSEAGGMFTQNVEFAYTDQMQLSELQLRFQLKNSKKPEYGFYYVNANSSSLLSDEENEAAAGSSAISASGVVIAKGVNTLQNDFCFGAIMDAMANDYKAVTYDKSQANIKYSISSSNVSKSALSDAQMTAFKEAVEAAQNNQSATQTVSANGYASPDGPEKFNDKLSSARSESAMKAMKKFFEEMGIEADAASYGEDWDGFKELVSASSIQDKNLILQVLSLYDSSVEREAEIKNLASVYTELKNEILPELRRAQIVSNISIQGKSDAEMLAIVASKNYGELTQEELLHIAEVSTKNETKKDVLDYAAKKYSDARAYNNLGIVLAKMGEAEASLEAFEMATRNGASDATINKNLVLANLDNNNYAEAKKYSGDSVAAAAVAAIEGNYAPATSAFEGYNAAIAYIMSNNYSAAKSAIASKKCPSADYLRGVIASAEGEVEAGISYIKSAVAAAPEMADKAKLDVNLANLFEGGLEL